MFIKALKSSEEYLLYVLAVCQRSYKRDIFTFYEGIVEMCSQCKVNYARAHFLAALQKHEQNQLMNLLHVIRNMLLVVLITKTFSSHLHLD